MTNRNSGFIDPAVALIAVGVVVVGGLIFIGGPQYNVWQQSLAGKAELQKAEYTRQVAVLEAQAKKDSAQQLADAEIIRATGVAKANQIIGDSLKGNPAYLQYLWITQGEENTNRTVYMVPSNGGAPVPTFDIQQAPAIKK
jgi:regulator of protease activity HflC (stomatin/prohibitin superfamily)